MREAAVSGANRSCRLTRDLAPAPSRLKALLFQHLCLRPLVFAACQVNLRASCSMNKLEFYLNRSQTERVATHEFIPLYTRVRQNPCRPRGSSANTADDALFSILFLLDRCYRRAPPPHPFIHAVCSGSIVQWALLSVYKKTAGGHSMHQL